MNVRQYYAQLPDHEKSTWMDKVNKKTGLSLSTIRNVVYGHQNFGRRHHETIAKLTNNKVKSVKKKSKLKDLIE